ncbi:MAG: hypothetical protein ACOYXB_00570 [Bacteroidota bacterium]
MATSNLSREEKIKLLKAFEQGEITPQEFREACRGAVIIETFLDLMKVSSTGDPRPVIVRGPIAEFLNQNLE